MKIIDLNKGLKPCPFCGSKASDYDTGDGWYIACDNCFCNIGYNVDGFGDVYGEFETYKEAFKAWNERNNIELIIDLQKLCISSCDCMTKTPEIEYHKDYCMYKKIQKLIEKYKD